MSIFFVTYTRVGAETFKIFGKFIIRFPLGFPFSKLSESQFFVSTYFSLHVPIEIEEVIVIHNDFEHNSPKYNLVEVLKFKIELFFEIYSIFFDNNFNETLNFEYKIFYLHK